MEVGLNVMARDGRMLTGEAEEIKDLVMGIVKASELVYSQIGKGPGKIVVDLENQKVFIYVLRDIVVFSDAELSERDLLKLARKYGK